MQVNLPHGMDPAFYALSLLRRRQLYKCIRITNHYLQKQQEQTKLSFAVEAQLWYVQKKAMIAQNYYQDVDIIDDDNNNNTIDEEIIEKGKNEKNESTNTKQRPMSARYGYNRGNNEGDDDDNNNKESNSTQQTTALSSRAGFRPMSSRLARVATASLLNVNENNNNNKSLSGMDVTKLDLHKIGQCKPMLAKLLCEYLFYVEHKPKLACELCQAALQLDLLDSHFNVSNSEKKKKKNEVETLKTVRKISLKHPKLEQEANLPPLLPSTSTPSNKEEEQKENATNTNNDVIYEEQIGITQKDDWW